MCKIIQHHKIFKETGGDTKTEQQTKLVRKLLVKFADYGLTDIAAARFIAACRDKKGSIKIYINKN